MVVEVEWYLLVLTRVYVPASALMMSFVFTGLFFGGVAALGRAVVSDVVARIARRGLRTCILCELYVCRCCLLVVVMFFLRAQISGFVSQLPLTQRLYLTTYTRPCPRAHQLLASRLYLSIRTRVLETKHRTPAANPTSLVFGPSPH